MGLILNIDTATEHAFVCLSANGEVLASEENTIQKEHASFVHTAIKNIMEHTGKSFKAIEAIAVTSGPGSYTGLRVGMATAKGLCYSLQKPLITLNTLEVMAVAAIAVWKKKITTGSLFCPMIDARRDEVYTALYDSEMVNRLAPCATILEPKAFEDWLEKYNLVFFGNGSNKFKSLAKNKNISFLQSAYKPVHLASLSAKAYNELNFANLAYIEPLYLKGFYSKAKDGS